MGLDRNDYVMGVLRMKSRKKIPVTIVTGFLGAGKTTVLNRILSDQAYENSAVIVNEFGNIGIDSKLLTTTKEEIIEINSGCICCNVRGDLIKILKTYIRRMAKGEVYFDRIIIETTGLANPAPVIQTFLMDEVMMNWFEIDAVCTVIDPVHIEQHIKEAEVQEQIAFADAIIFNKTDLITKQSLLELQARVLKMNPMAKQLVSINGQVKLDEIINIYTFDLEKKLEIEPNLLKDNLHSHHGEGVGSFVIEDVRPLNLSKLNEWFSYLVQVEGESLYRYKGILHIEGLADRVVFQGVHMLFNSNQDRAWKKGEKRTNQLVFIGKDLDEAVLRKEFLQCLS